MAGTITHYWNGTQLVVTSDSGTSATDLSGPTGPRGPQGRPGVIYDTNGNLVLDDIPSGAEIEALEDRMTKLENSHGVTTEYVATKIEAELADYYTKEQTDAKLKNVDLDGYATEEYVQQYVKQNGGGGSVDLTNYATKAYVNNAVANVEADVDLTNYTTFDDVSAAIAQAQLGGTGDGSGVDLSAFATKTYVNNMADGDTIEYKNGHISTTFGGKVIGHEGGEYIAKFTPDNVAFSGSSPKQYLITSYRTRLTNNNFYKIAFTFSNGKSVSVDKVFYLDTSWQDVPTNDYFTQIAFMHYPMGTMIALEVIDPSIWVDGFVESVTIHTSLTNVYEPIDANAMPIDPEQFSIYKGMIQLSPEYAVTWNGVYEEIALQIENAGGGSGTGGSVDLSNYYTKEEVDDKIADAGTVDLTNYYTKAQVQAYVLEQRNAIENWVLEQIAASGGSAPSSEEVEY